MTRGMRLMIVFCFIIGVIVLMMDCTRKSMRKKKQEATEDGRQGWFVPDPGPPLRDA
jgi:hypothetical protein